MLAIQTTLIIRNRRPISFFLSFFSFFLFFYEDGAQCKMVSTMDCRSFFDRTLITDAWIWLSGVLSCQVFRYEGSLHFPLFTYCAEFMGLLLCRLQKKVPFDSLEKSRNPYKKSQCSSFIVWGFLGALFLLHSPPPPPYPSPPE